MNTHKFLVAAVVTALLIGCSSGDGGTGGGSGGSGGGSGGGAAGGSGGGAAGGSGGGTAGGSGGGTAGGSGGGTAGGSGGGTAGGSGGGTAGGSGGGTAGGSGGGTAGGSGGGTAGGSGGGTAGGSGGGAAGGAGGGAGGGSASGCGFDGTWNATSVSCDGGAVSLGAFSWVAHIDGGSGAFVETIAGCSLTEAGPLSCANNVLTTQRNQPYGCSPAACSPFTAQCGAPPDGGTASWSVSQVTATTFVLTSLNLPDGGPTPIKTCTGLGKQNPVQVTWTKQ